MKITQSQLRQIIKEELSRVLKENSPEELLGAIKQTLIQLGADEKGASATAVALRGLSEKDLKDTLHAFQTGLAKKTGLPVDETVNRGETIDEGVNNIINEDAEEPSAVETMNGQYVGKPKDEIKKAMEMYEKRVRTQHRGDPDYDPGALKLYHLLQDYYNKGTFKGAKRHPVPSSESDWDSI